MDSSAPSANLNSKTAKKAFKTRSGRKTKIKGSADVTPRAVRTLDVDRIRTRGGGTPTRRITGRGDTRGAGLRTGTRRGRTTGGRLIKGTKGGDMGRQLIATCKTNEINKLISV